VSDPTVEKLGLGQVGLGTGGLGCTQFEVSADTLQSEGVPYLDPQTLDFAHREGILLGGSAARQRMIVLLVTQFGSSMAVDGTSFPEFHDETAEQISKSEVRNALAPMLAETPPPIRLDSIRVEKEVDGVVGRLGIFVDFFDYQLGKKDTLEL
jgi:hypothetical protein